MMREEEVAVDIDGCSRRAAAAAACVVNWQDKVEVDMDVWCD